MLLHNKLTRLTTVLAHEQQDAHMVRILLAVVWSKIRVEEVYERLERGRLVRCGVGFYVLVDKLVTKGLG